MADDEKDTSTEKIIVGVSVGVGCLLLAAVFVLTYLLCRRRRQEKEEAAKEAERLVITPDGESMGESTDGDPVFGGMHSLTRDSRSVATTDLDSLHTQTGQVFEHKFYPSYKSPDPLPGYESLPDANSPYFLPVHSYQDPFQRKIPPGISDPTRHGSQRSGSGSLAVVPFRQSQLPVSNVHYSMDGRLYTGEEDFRGRPDLGWEQLRGSPDLGWEQHLLRHYSYPVPAGSPYEPYFERVLFERRAMSDEVYHSGRTPAGYSRGWSISSRAIPFRNRQLGLAPFPRYSGRRGDQFRYGQVSRRSVGRYEPNWRIHTDRISPRVSSSHSSCQSVPEVTMPFEHAVYPTAADQSRRQAADNARHSAMSNFDIPLQEFSSLRMPDHY